MDLRVDGRRVFAATGGRAFDPAQPTVALVHGAAMDHSVWAMQARYLAHHGHAVLAFDLPGHGRSEGAPIAAVDDLAGWLWRALEAAGAARAALVGHSMGALIALAAAGTQPGRTTALALLGVALPMAVHPDLLAAAAADPAAAYAVMTGWAHAPAMLLGGQAVPGLWSAGATRQLLERARPGVLHTDLAAVVAWERGLEAAGRVRCPTLLLLGERDRMTPPARARELAAALPGSQTTLVPGCGHMMMAEAPDAVTDALAAFLAQTKGAAEAAPDGVAGAGAATSGRSPRSAS